MQGQHSTPPPNNELDLYVGLHQVPFVIENKTTDLLS
jgi:hypothetical protein